MRQDRALKYLRRVGIARARELAERGLSSPQITRMVRDGRLLRVDRGLYSLPGAAITEHASLVSAVQQVPGGVICLLSALRFHGLTSQAPFEVWIAIGPKAWRPSRTSTRLRVVRFSKEARSAGIEHHKANGVTLAVYGPAKTVADCFKYRNKIGLDVAIEALRDCIRERKCTRDDIWRFAKICRVANVMRPYLESLS